VAKGSLRRFDVQAKLALVLSLVALVFCAGLGFLIFRNWRADTGQIIYNSGGIFAPVFLSLAAASALISVFAAALGFNSAGQRRNERQSSSWIGFFVGMGALTCTVVFLAAYFMLSNTVKV
jgi:hypothetical protein